MLRCLPTVLRLSLAMAFGVSPGVLAQEPHWHHPRAAAVVTVHDSTATMPAMRVERRVGPMPGMIRRPFGIPMTRMGSGTAWLPDASAMRAWHLRTGGWMLMIHGDAFLQYDHQGGPR